MSRIRQIQKKHSRVLRQKEKRYYKNLCRSNNRKSHYFSLYKKHRGRNRSFLQNKRRLPKQTSIFRKTSGNVVTLPSHIDFYKNQHRNWTIEALLDIHTYKQKEVLIDFSNVIVMSAAATAMLFSVIKHIKLNFNVTVKIKLPKSSSIQAILKQIKLLDFTQTHSNIDVTEHKNVKRWYSEDGHTLLKPEDIAKIVGGIIKNCKENQNIDIKQYRKKIDLTISEAILNINDHAYLDSGLNYKNWVFFARFIANETNGDKLVLVISDSGVGIANTFKQYIDKENSAWGEFAKYFKREDNYIKEAVTNFYKIPKKLSERNKKRAPGRGTGLTKIYEDTKTKNTLLNIYSHKGHFSSNGNSVKFKKSFPGTVIELIIPL